MSQALGDLALRGLQAGLHRVLCAKGFAPVEVSTSLGMVRGYELSGRGPLPPTVLIHGLGSQAAPFAKLAQKLGPDVERVLLPDALGHGRSDPGPFGSGEPLTERLLLGLRTFIEATERGRVALYGCSLGGALALQYALRYPERVSTLVLVSPAAVPLSDEERANILSLFEQARRGAPHHLAERLYANVPWYLPAVSSVLGSLMRRPALSELFAELQSAPSIPSEELRTLRVPTLVIWGDRDHLLPQTWHHRLRETLPGHVRFELPEGLGHCPHIEHVDQVAKLTRQFMKDPYRIPS